MVSGDNRDHGDNLAGDRMKPTPLIITLATLAIFVGCNGTKNESTTSSQPDRPLVNDHAFGVDLAEARRGFTTKLNRRGPAPQEFEEATPPAGVKEVLYTSGELKLKAWLSEDPGQGKKRPAVVYLHGGWSFAPIDWQDAARFVDAGFVVMMPMLRSENGNPGIYEGFYGEVDDAIAAGRFVSELSYVDKDNVFVAGHSVGGFERVSGYGQLVGIRTPLARHLRYIEPGGNPTAKPDGFPGEFANTADSLR